MRCVSALSKNEVCRINIAAPCVSFQTAVLCVDFILDGLAVAAPRTPLTTRSSTRAATVGQADEQLIDPARASASEICEDFTPASPPLTRAVTAAAADEHASRQSRKMTAPRSEKL